MTCRRLLAVLALLCAAASQVSAQSLFATRGLGVPVSAVDARAAALGAIGVGLIGFHTTMTNPAELAGLTRRGVSAAIQPVTTDVNVENASDGTSGTRFPMLSVLYPVSPRLVLSLGYAGYLDQSWGILDQSELVINGDTVPVNDRIESTGGISQLRLNAAWSVSRTFSIGAAAGLLAGNVDRSVARTFSDSAGTIAPFVEEMRWRYSAPMAAVGIRWDPASRFRVGASAMIGGDVEAKTDDEDGEDRSYGAPLELNAGASYRVSPILTVNAGGAWGRAPSTAGDAERSTTIRVGGGVEYLGVRSGLRTYPVRLGARWAQLPYHLVDETQPTEWGITGGVGFRLGDPMDPTAVADFGIERGARNGLTGGAVNGGVDEQLWRITFSLSLFAR